MSKTKEQTQPKKERKPNNPVLTVDVSWTGITMQPETSSTAIKSRNLTGQEVSHSDPHVGGL
jgi:hypothetical protein